MEAAVKIKQTEIRRCMEISRVNINMHSHNKPVLGVGVGMVVGLLQTQNLFYGATIGYPLLHQLRASAIR